MCGREHSLQVLTPIPIHPPIHKRAVRALQAWSLPWERVCCTVRIRSSRLQTQWIEGAWLWRISAYSTRFVASYPHRSTLQSRQKAPDCGDVSISEELGLTGRPSKHAKLSSRITIFEYKRTCQLLSTRASTKFLKR